MSGLIFSSSCSVRSVRVRRAPSSPHHVKKIQQKILANFSESKHATSKYMVPRNDRIGEFVTSKKTCPMHPYMKAGGLDPCILGCRDSLRFSPLSTAVSMLFWAGSRCRDGGGHSCSRRLFRSSRRGVVVRKRSVPERVPSHESGSRIYPRGKRKIRSL